MNRVSRRRFIIGLAAAGGGFVLMITARHAAGKRLMIKLKDLLPDPGAAQEAGRLYLRRYPEENNVDRLVDELLPGTFFSLLRMNPAVLHRSLHEKIREDFKDENIVHLDGWMLSRTEARLYALLHLTLEET